MVLELVALTTVLPGEELNTAYTSCQAGTRERRETLWDNWYFSCSCHRSVSKWQYSINYRL